MNYESKVTGTVDNITYYNAQNGFTVLDLDVSGELLTCVGPIPDVSKGEELVLTGRYDNHSTYGRQFRVEFYERHLPETAAQLLKYLSSRTIKGIGQRTAVKIIERFGERTFDILEKEPERLTEIKGFTLEKARAVSNEFNKQFAVRTIMISLERYGIKPYECIAIYKRFGINAAAVVTENPYILCASIEGISFDRAEEIAGKLPCKPADTYRIKAGIAHILRHNLYNGHTCVPKDKLPPLCKDLLGINAEETEACLSEMTGSKMIISENLEEREFLFLPHIYSAEKNIAERLKLFLKFPPASMPTLEKDIEEIEEINKIKYERLQREAIMTAAEKGMLILTGGPGTGKTTTVRGIISLFEKSKIRILMAAPTGRAAKRMNELTGRDAKTIHRLLEVEWDANDKQRFKRNVANPLECGAIIIDELSMVDVELFSSLLDALPIGCRIIMLGDYDQLPPVGAGNVLSDLLKSEIMPIVRLKEIFRQAEKSLIVMNAHAVVSGQMPVLDARESDFFFMARTNSVSAAETVAELVSSRLPAAYGYSPKDDIQVLCPSRKGDCGSMNLNRRMQSAINPPSEEKREFNSLGRLFREGDKVMQIKNNYDLEWIKLNEAGIGVFNGDIGIIENIEKDESVFIINFDGRVCKYPFEHLAELEPAYAVTVHKSQGSEFPAVVIPIIDAPNQLMYRNLLYTAITRAKDLLVIVGNEAKIRMMAENNVKTKRYSGLWAFLMQEDVKV